MAFKIKHRILAIEAKNRKARQALFKSCIKLKALIADKLNSQELSNLNKGNVNV